MDIVSVQLDKQYIVYTGAKNARRVARKGTYKGMYSTRPEEVLGMDDARMRHISDAIRHPFKTTVTV